MQTVKVERKRGSKARPMHWTDPEGETRVYAEECEWGHFANPNLMSHEDDCGCSACELVELGYLSYLGRFDRDQEFYGQESDDPFNPIVPLSEEQLKVLVRSYARAENTAASWLRPVPDREPDDECLMYGHVKAGDNIKDKGRGTIGCRLCSLASDYLRRYEEITTHAEAVAAVEKKHPWLASGGTKAEYVATVWSETNLSLEVAERILDGWHEVTDGQVSRSAGAITKVLIERGESDTALSGDGAIDREDLRQEGLLIFARDKVYQGKNQDDQFLLRCMINDLTDYLNNISVSRYNRRRLAEEELVDELQRRGTDLSIPAVWPTGLSGEERQDYLLYQESRSFTPADDTWNPGGEASDTRGLVELAWDDELPEEVDGDDEECVTVEHGFEHVPVRMETKKPEVKVDPLTRSKTLSRVEQRMHDRGSVTRIELDQDGNIINQKEN